MELSRRDALAALVAAGVGVSIETTANPPSSAQAPKQSPPDHVRSSHSTLSSHEFHTLTNIAQVIYPKNVTGITPFIDTYLTGRTDPGFLTGVSEAVAVLDDHAQDWYNALFVNLTPETQRQLLTELGTTTAVPDPTGSPAGKIRYYLINELLFALYTSPTGASLVGLDNPQGYPGGIESYQRGPSP